MAKLEFEVIEPSIFIEGADWSDVIEPSLLSVHVKSTRGWDRYFTVDNHTGEFTDITDQIEAKAALGFGNARPS